jgi:hypothetical protein
MGATQARETFDITQIRITWREHSQLDKQPEKTRIRFGGCCNFNLRGKVNN